MSIRSRTPWHITRPVVTGRRGVVAAKTPDAVAAGIAMLERGGNAIDAAVATAFAVGVSEPWMNGVGGGGYLVAWIASEQRSVAIEYPMISPAGATPDMFPLSGTAPDSSLFGWPATVGNANVVGHRAAAIPGTVDGLALALERYGTKSLAEVLEPAIEIAENGLEVTWHTTGFIARDIANLSRFPATAAIYLDDQGHAPVTTYQHLPTVIRNPDLARTLRGIAEHGPRWFYESEIAETFASHFREHGGTHTADDFRSYHARETTPRSVPYGEYDVHTIGGPSGGSTLAQMLLLLDRLDARSLGHNTPEALHLLAQVGRRAYADRFSYFADPEHIDVPWEAFLSESYVEAMASAIGKGAIVRPSAGCRDELGITHDLAASVPEYMKDGSTTHLSVADGDGNAVSITQTLLAGWGSRVVVPGTGVLFNNGMMWFDPEPGRPNSVAGRKVPLSNMAPVVVSRDGGAAASIGSSGGRKIAFHNTQVTMNVLDHRMGMQEAIDAPVIDISTPLLVASSHLPGATLEVLRSLGHEIAVRDPSRMTGDFASPTGVLRHASGSLEGGADPWYYPASVGGL
ncbi:MAG TPA: gamma-glutamyltransferase family protein [Thermomicrobiales bacterium]|nr:gamma-glutamyltransferase family protein [Thermomicrobiales bacterium]